MITTFTTKNNTHHFHTKSDQLNAELFEETDPFFYEVLKKELDLLMKEPSDEVIDRIMAYAKTK